MASLDLKIEFEDNPALNRQEASVRQDESAKQEASDKQEASSIGGSLMQSLRQSWKSKADSSSNTPGTIHDTSAALANILRNFLQPKSALSLHEASESILKLIPANASHSTEVRVFGDYCIELADQIPYHHPSHLKLAHLLKRLNLSSKFTDKNPKPDGSEEFNTFQLLREAIKDNVHFPEEDDPIVFVNFQAFIATTCSVGIDNRSGADSWAVQVLRIAFETLEKREKWETESYIMGAAQWILIYGQGLFQHILYPASESEEQETRNHSWRFGDDFPKPEAMEPRSIERWRFWQDCFDRRAQDSDTGKECANVAQKAVELMKVIDRTYHY